MQMKDTVQSDVLYTAAHEGGGSGCLEPTPQLDNAKWVARAPERTDRAGTRPRRGKEVTELGYRLSGGPMEWRMLEKTHGVRC